MLGTVRIASEANSLIHGSRTSQPPMLTPLIVSLPQWNGRSCLWLLYMKISKGYQVIPRLLHVAYVGAAKLAEAAHNAKMALESILQVTVATLG